MREKCDKYKHRQVVSGKRKILLNRERKEVTDNNLYQNGQWQSL